jgi:hypothetical protein
MVKILQGSAVLGMGIQEKCQLCQHKIRHPDISQQLFLLSHDTHLLIQLREDSPGTVGLLQIVIHPLEFLPGHIGHGNREPVAFSVLKMFVHFDSFH